MPAKSGMMDELYGVVEADNVYNRIQALDPQLNEEIQRIAYDHFWARPGLDVRDKSYVTVVSLLAMGKEEQIRIHLNGLFNNKVSVITIIETIELIGTLRNVNSTKNGLIALREVLHHRVAAPVDLEAVERALLSIEQKHQTESAHLTQRDRDIASVSTFVASGDLIKLKVAMCQYFKNGGDIEMLKNILIHQIVYCGFPSTMNGFAVLQDLQK